MKIIPAYSNGDSEVHFYARSLHMYRTIWAYLFVERASGGRLGDCAWWIKYSAAYKAVISASSFQCEYYSFARADSFSLRRNAEQGDTRKFTGRSMECDIIDKILSNIPIYKADFALAKIYMKNIIL